MDIQRKSEILDVMEERAFINWINSELKELGDNETVTDLSKDLKSGVILLKLIGKLTRQNLKPQQSSTTGTDQNLIMDSVANIETFLKQLHESGVPIGKIRAHDIYQGKKDVILPLLWNMILYYQIKPQNPDTWSMLMENRSKYNDMRKTSLSDTGDFLESQHPFFPTFPMEFFEMGYPRELLQDWCNKYYGPIDPKSARNVRGKDEEILLLNNLVDKILQSPDSRTSKISLDRLDKDTADKTLKTPTTFEMDRLEKAYDIVGHNMGISTLPFSVIKTRYDEKSLIHYLTHLFQSYVSSQKDVKSAQRSPSPGGLATQNTEQLGRLLNDLKKGVHNIINQIDASIPNLAQQEFLLWCKIITQNSGLYDKMRDAYSKPNPYDNHNITKEIWHNLNAHWENVEDIKSRVSQKLNEILFKDIYNLYVISGHQNLIDKSTFQSTEDLSIIPPSPKLSQVNKSNLRSPAGSFSFLNPMDMAQSETMSTQKKSSHSLHAYSPHNQSLSPQSDGKSSDINNKVAIDKSNIKIDARKLSEIYQFLLAYAKYKQAINAFNKSMEKSLNQKDVLSTASKPSTVSLQNESEDIKLNSNLDIVMNNLKGLVKSHDQSALLSSSQTSDPKWMDDFKSMQRSLDEIQVVNNAWNIYIREANTARNWLDQVRTSKKPLTLNDIKSHEDLFDNIDKYGGTLTANMPKLVAPRLQAHFSSLIKTWLELRAMLEKQGDKELPWTEISHKIEQLDTIGPANNQSYHDIIKDNNKNTSQSVNRESKLKFTATSSPPVQIKASVTANQSLGQKNNKKFKDTLAENDMKITKMLQRPMLIATSENQSPKNSENEGSNVKQNTSLNKSIKPTTIELTLHHEVFQPLYQKLYGNNTTAKDENICLVLTKYQKYLKEVLPALQTFKSQKGKRLSGYESDILDKKINIAERNLANLASLNLDTEPKRLSKLESDLQKCSNLVRPDSIRTSNFEALPDLGDQYTHTIDNVFRPWGDCVDTIIRVCNENMELDPFDDTEIPGLYNQTQKIHDAYLNNYNASNKFGSQLTDLIPHVLQFNHTLDNVYLYISELRRILTKSLEDCRTNHKKFTINMDESVYKDIEMQGKKLSELLLTPPQKSALQGKLDRCQRDWNICVFEINMLTLLNNYAIDERRFQDIYNKVVEELNYEQKSFEAGTYDIQSILDRFRTMVILSWANMVEEDLSNMKQGLTQSEKLFSHYDAPLKTTDLRYQTSLNKQIAGILQDLHEISPNMQELTKAQNIGDLRVNLIDKSLHHNYESDVEKWKTLRLRLNKFEETLNTAVKYDKQLSGGMNDITLQTQALVTDTHKLYDTIIHKPDGFEASKNDYLEQLNLIKTRLQGLKTKISELEADRIKNHTPHDIPSTIHERYNNQLSHLHQNIDELSTFLVQLEHNMHDMQNLSQFSKNTRVQRLSIFDPSNWIKGASTLTTTTNIPSPLNTATKLDGLDRNDISRLSPTPVTSIAISKVVKSEIPFTPPTKDALVNKPTMIDAESMKENFKYPYEYYVEKDPNQPFKRVPRTDMGDIEHKSAPGETLKQNTENPETQSHEIKPSYVSTFHVDKPKTHPLSFTPNSSESNTSTDPEIQTSSININISAPQKLPNVTHLSSALGQTGVPTFSIPADQLAQNQSSSYLSDRYSSSTNNPSNSDIIINNNYNNRKNKSTLFTTNDPQNNNNNTSTVDKTFVSKLIVSEDLIMKSGKQNSKKKNPNLPPKSNTNDHSEDLDIYHPMPLVPKMESGPVQPFGGLQNTTPPHPSNSTTESKLLSETSIPHTAALQASNQTKMVERNETHDLTSSDVKDSQQSERINKISDKVKIGAAGIISGVGAVASSIMHGIPNSQDNSSTNRPKTVVSQASDTETKREDPFETYYHQYGTDPHLKEIEEKISSQHTTITPSNIDSNDNINNVTKPGNSNNINNITEKSSGTTSSHDKTLYFDGKPLSHDMEKLPLSVLSQNYSKPTHKVVTDERELVDSSKASSDNQEKSEPAIVLSSMLPRSSISDEFWHKDDRNTKVDRKVKQKIGETESEMENIVLSGIGEHAPPQIVREKLDAKLAEEPIDLLKHPVARNKQHDNINLSHVGANGSGASSPHIERKMRDVSPTRAELYYRKGDAPTANLERIADQYNQASQSEHEAFLHGQHTKPSSHLDTSGASITQGIHSTINPLPHLPIIETKPIIIDYHDPGLVELPTQERQAQIAEALDRGEILHHGLIGGVDPSQFLVDEAKVLSHISHLGEYAPLRHPSEALTHVLETHPKNIIIDVNHPAHGGHHGGNKVSPISTEYDNIGYSQRDVVPTNVGVKEPQVIFPVTRRSFKADVLPTKHYVDKTGARSYEHHVQEPRHHDVNDVNVPANPDEKDKPDEYENEYNIADDENTKLLGQPHPSMLIKQNQGATKVSRTENEKHQAFVPATEYNKKSDIGHISASDSGYNKPNVIQPVHAQSHMPKVENVTSNARQNNVGVVSSLANKSTVHVDNTQIPEAIKIVGMAPRNSISDDFWNTPVDSSDKTSKKGDSTSKPYKSNVIQSVNTQSHVPKVENVASDLRHNVGAPSMANKNTYADNPEIPDAIKIVGMAPRNSISDDFWSTPVISSDTTHGHPSADKNVYENKMTKVGKVHPQASDLSHPTNAENTRTNVHYSLSDKHEPLADLTAKSVTNQYHKGNVDDLSSDMRKKPIIVDYHDSHIARHPDQTTQSNVAHRFDEHHDRDKPIIIDYQDPKMMNLSTQTQQNQISAKGNAQFYETHQINPEHLPHLKDNQKYEQFMNFGHPSAQLTKIIAKPPGDTITGFHDQNVYSNVGQNMGSKINESLYQHIDSHLVDHHNVPSKTEIATTIPYQVKAPPPPQHEPKHVVTEIKPNQVLPHTLEQKTSHYQPGIPQQSKLPHEISSHPAHAYDRPERDEIAIDNFNYSRGEDENIPYPYGKYEHQTGIDDSFSKPSHILTTNTVDKNDISTGHTKTQHLESTHPSAQFKPVLSSTVASPNVNMAQSKVEKPEIFRQVDNVDKTYLNYSDSNPNFINQYGRVPFVSDAKRAEEPTFVNAQDEAMSQMAKNFANTIAIGTPVFIAAKTANVPKDANYNDITKPMSERTDGKPLFPSDSNSYKGKTFEGGPVIENKGVSDFYHHEKRPEPNDQHYNQKMINKNVPSPSTPKDTKHVEQIHEIKPFAETHQHVDKQRVTQQTPNLASPFLVHGEPVSNTSFQNNYDNQMNQIAKNIAQTAIAATPILPTQKTVALDSTKKPVEYNKNQPRIDSPHLQQSSSGKNIAVQKEVSKMPESSGGFLSFGSSNYGDKDIDINDQNYFVHQITPETHRTHDNIHAKTNLTTVNNDKLGINKQHPEYYKDIEIPVEIDYLDYTDKRPNFHDPNVLHGKRSTPTETFGDILVHGEPISTHQPNSEKQLGQLAKNIAGTIVAATPALIAANTITDKLSPKQGNADYTFSQSQSIKSDKSVGQQPLDYNNDRDIDLTDQSYFIHQIKPEMHETHGTKSFTDTKYTKDNTKAGTKQHSEFYKDIEIPVEIDYLDYTEKNPTFYDKFGNKIVKDVLVTTPYKPTNSNQTKTYMTDKMKNVPSSFQTAQGHNANKPEHFIEIERVDDDYLDYTDQNPFFYDKFGNIIKTPQKIDNAATVMINKKTAKGNNGKQTQYIDKNIIENNTKKQLIDNNKRAGAYHDNSVKQQNAPEYFKEIDRVDDDYLDYTDENPFFYDKFGNKISHDGKVTQQQQTHLAEGVSTQKPDKQHFADNQTLTKSRPEYFKEIVRIEDDYLDYTDKHPTFVDEFGNTVRHVNFTDTAQKGRPDLTKNLIDNTAHTSQSQNNEFNQKTSLGGNMKGNAVTQNQPQQSMISKREKPEFFSEVERVEDDYLDYTDKNPNFFDQFGNPVHSSSLQHKGRPELRETANKSSKNTSPNQKYIKSDIVDHNTDQKGRPKQHQPLKNENKNAPLKDHHIDKIIAKSPAKHTQNSDVKPIPIKTMESKGRPTSPKLNKSNALKQNVVPENILYDQKTNGQDIVSYNQALPNQKSDIGFNTNVKNNKNDNNHQIHIHQVKPQLKPGLQPSDTKLKDQGNNQSLHHLDGMGQTLSLLRSEQDTPKAYENVPNKSNIKKRAQSKSPPKNKNQPNQKRVESKSPINNQNNNNNNKNNRKNKNTARSVSRNGRQQEYNQQVANKGTINQRASPHVIGIESGHVHLKDHPTISSPLNSQSKLLLHGEEKNLPKQGNNKISSVQSTSKPQNNSGEQYQYPIPHQSPLEALKHHNAPNQPLRHNANYDNTSMEGFDAKDNRNIHHQAAPVHVPNALTTEEFETDGLPQRDYDKHSKEYHFTEHNDRVKPSPQHHHRAAEKEQKRERDVEEQYEASLPSGPLPNDIKIGHSVVHTNKPVDRSDHPVNSTQYDDKKSYIKSPSKPQNVVAGDHYQYPTPHQSPLEALKHHNVPNQPTRHKANYSDTAVEGFNAKDNRNLHHKADPVHVPDALTTEEFETDGLPQRDYDKHSKEYHFMQRNDRVKPSPQHHHRAAEKEEKRERDVEEQYEASLPSGPLPNDIKIGHSVVHTNKPGDRNDHHPMKNPNITTADKNVLTKSNMDFNEGSPFSETINLVNHNLNTYKIQEYGKSVRHPNIDNNNTPGQADHKPKNVRERSIDSGYGLTSAQISPATPISPLISHHQYSPKSDVSGQSHKLHQQTSPRINTESIQVTPDLTNNDQFFSGKDDRNTRIGKIHTSNTPTVEEYEAKLPTSSNKEETSTSHKKRTPSFKQVMNEKGELVTIINPTAFEASIVCPQGQSKTTVSSDKELSKHEKEWVQNKKQVGVVEKDTDKIQHPAQAPKQNKEKIGQTNKTIEPTSIYDINYRLHHMLQKPENFKNPVYVTEVQKLVSDAKQKIDPLLHSLNDNDHNDAKIKILQDLTHLNKNVEKTKHAISVHQPMADIKELNALNELAQKHIPELKTKLSDPKQKEINQKLNTLEGMVKSSKNLLTSLSGEQAPKFHEIETDFKKIQNIKDIELIKAKLATLIAEIKPRMEKNQKDFENIVTQLKSSNLSAEAGQILKKLTNETQATNQALNEKLNNLNKIDANLDAITKFFSKFEKQNQDILNWVNQTQPMLGKEKIVPDKKTLADISKQITANTLTLEESERACDNVLEPNSSVSKSIKKSIGDIKQKIQQVDGMYKDALNSQTTLAKIMDQTGRDIKRIEKSVSDLQDQRQKARVDELPQHLKNVNILNDYKKIIPVLDHFNKTGKQYVQLYPAISQIRTGLEKFGHEKPQFNKNLSPLYDSLNTLTVNAEDLETKDKDTLRYLFKKIDNDLKSDKHSIDKDFKEINNFISSQGSKPDEMDFDPNSQEITDIQTRLDKIKTIDKYKSAYLDSNLLPKLSETYQIYQVDVHIPAVDKLKDELSSTRKVIGDSETQLKKIKQERTNYLKNTQSELEKIESCQRDLVREAQKFNKINENHDYETLSDKIEAGLKPALKTFVNAYEPRIREIQNLVTQTVSTPKHGKDSQSQKLSEKAKALTTDYYIPITDWVQYQIKNDEDLLKQAEPLFEEANMLTNKLSQDKTLHDLTNALKHVKSGTVLSGSDEGGLLANISPTNLLGKLGKTFFSSHNQSTDITDNTLSSAEKGSKSSRQKVKSSSSNNQHPISTIKGGDMELTIDHNAPSYQTHLGTGNIKFGKTNDSFPFPSAVNDKLIPFLKPGEKFSDISLQDVLDHVSNIKHNYWSLSKPLITNLLNFKETSLDKGHGKQLQTHDAYVEKFNKLIGDNTKIGSKEKDLSSNDTPMLHKQCALYATQLQQALENLDSDKQQFLKAVKAEIPHYLNFIETNMPYRKQKEVYTFDPNNKTHGIKPIALKSMDELTKYRSQVVLENEDISLLLNLLDRIEREISEIPELEEYLKQIQELRKKLNSVKTYLEVRHNDTELAITHVNDIIREHKELEGKLEPVHKQYQQAISSKPLYVPGLQTVKELGHSLLTDVKSLKASKPFEWHKMHVASPLALHVDIIPAVMNKLNKVEANVKNMISEVDNKLKQYKEQPLSSTSKSLVGTSSAPKKIDENRQKAVISDFENLCKQAYLTEGESSQDKSLGDKNIDLMLLGKRLIQDSKEALANEAKDFDRVKTLNGQLLKLSSQLTALKEPRDMCTFIPDDLDDNKKTQYIHLQKEYKNALNDAQNSLNQLIPLKNNLQSLIDLLNHPDLFQQRFNFHIPKDSHALTQQLNKNFKSILKAINQRIKDYKSLGITDIQPESDFTPESPPSTPVDEEESQTDSLVLKIIDLKNKILPSSVTKHVPFSSPPKSLNEFDNDINQLNLKEIDEDISKFHNKSPYPIMKTYIDKFGNLVGEEKQQLTEALSHLIPNSGFNPINSLKGLVDNYYGTSSTLDAHSPDNLDSTGTQAERSRARRDRYRKLFWRSLPLQVLLVSLVGFACLLPMTSHNRYDCLHQNTFLASMNPSLYYPHGPPPL